MKKTSAKKIKSQMKTFLSSISNLSNKHNARNLCLFGYLHFYLEIFVLCLVFSALKCFFFSYKYFSLSWSDFEIVVTQKESEYGNYC